MPLVYGALSLQVTVHRKKRWRKTTSPRKQVYMRILKFLSTCYGCGAKVLSTKQVYIGKFMVPLYYIIWELLIHTYQIDGGKIHMIVGIEDLIRHLVW